jgi:hypothetical protein
MKISNVKYYWSARREIFWDVSFSLLPEFQLTRDTKHGKMTFSSKDNAIGGSGSV